MLTEADTRPPDRASPNAAGARTAAAQQPADAAADETLRQRLARCSLVWGAVWGRVWKRGGAGLQAQVTAHRCGSVGGVCCPSTASHASWLPCARREAAGPGGDEAKNREQSRAQRAFVSGATARMQPLPVVPHPVPHLKHDCGGGGIDVNPTHIMFEMTGGLVTAAHARPCSVAAAWPSPCAWHAWLLLATRRHSSGETIDRSAASEGVWRGLACRRAAAAAACWLPA